MFTKVSERIKEIVINSTNQSVSVWYSVAFKLKLSPELT